MLSEYDHCVLDAQTCQILTAAIDNQDGDLAQKIVQQIDGVQLAYFLLTSKYAHRKFLIETLQDTLLPEVLINVVPDIRIEIISILGMSTVARIISNLSAENIVTAVEDLEEQLKQDIVKLLPSELKKSVNELLSYPEDSAGRLIHKDVMMVPGYWKIGDLLDFLQDYDEKPQKFYQIFVVTPKLEPIGALSLDSVLCAAKDRLIQDVMSTDIKIIRPGLDQEEVASIFHKYSLIAAPVVNRNGRIIGVIVIDDVMSVVYQENEQDILHLGQVSETDITASLWQTVKKRFPWLVVNLFTATLTSLVIGLFGDALSHFVELSIVMPVIASMSGNAGLQALTITIRAIATKQLSHRNSARLLGKESMVGFVNGLIIAALSVIVIVLRFHDLALAFLFGISVVITFTISTLNGAAVPMMLRFFGFDPAVSSSIVICAASDTIAFSIFLGLATALLL